MIIDDLHLLGERLKKWLCAGVPWDDLDNAVLLSFKDNGFFSPYMQKRALGIICEDFLVEDKLSAWISGYLEEMDGGTVVNYNREKRVGIVMAGNIPLVGFSDLLAVLITGAKPIIKLSSKDKRLLPVLFPNLTYRTAEEFENEKLDAVITMGGSAAAAYYKEKFSGTKALIRGSRFSVGLVSGKETAEELKALAEDILLYYGMGCRSITRLFVPEGYDFSRLGQFINSFLNEHDLLFLENQYLRNRAVASIDGKSFFDTGSLLFVETTSTVVPISTLAYSYYVDMKEVEKYVHKNDIQKFFCTFGNAQRPSLMDYPDGVDVIKFLFNI